MEWEGSLIRFTLCRLALLSLLAVLTAAGALAEEGIERVELRRGDLTGSAGTEVIVSRLTLRPGARMPRHFHHGDEFLYVLEGGTIQVPGPKEVAFKAGDTAHFPRGQVHGGFTVVGDSALVAITTHIVDRGKPLIQIVAD